MNRSCVEHYRWGVDREGGRLLDGSNMSVVEKRIPPNCGEVWHDHQRSGRGVRTRRGSGELVDSTLRCSYHATVEPALLEQWMAQWRNIIDFDVHQLLSSAEAAERVLSAS